jgi:osmotically-inducible protein OsmY
MHKSQPNEVAYKMATNAATMSPKDSTTQFKVRLELRINPKSENFARDLKLSVLHGAVTLEGTVPSDIDRKNAERIALGVSGVSSVVNNLKVTQ